MWGTVLSIFLACSMQAQDEMAHAQRLRSSLLGIDTHIDTIQRVLVGHEATINDAGILAKRIRSEQELAHAFVVREDVTQQTATSTSF